MVQKVFSVRDSKSGIFNLPFHQLTHAEAERTFHKLVNDPKSFICEYSSDFDLYYLGEFDTVTGRYSSLDTPQHVIKAVQVVQPRGADLDPRLVAQKPLAAVQQ